MSSLLFPLLVSLGVLLVLALGAVAIFKMFYRKVNQGTALIVNDMSSKPKVSFTGALIIPVLYRAEEMQISVITMQVDRRGKEGLICKDNLRADISVAFYLRVNETPEDVLKVAKTVGAQRASNKGAVDELFNAKFSEALKTVGKRLEFLELFENRKEFRDAIVEVIGTDLNGYVLEDVAIDYLEQTKKSDLDPNNIMDAEGIRKITQMTAAQNIQTNDLVQEERLAVTKKNTTTREAMLTMERQTAEAEAVQQREIATVQAREKAEAEKVTQQQRQVAEHARLEADETIRIREQNQEREVEVAEQNRRRVVAIEEARVERARQLEQVTTDREVQMQVVERDLAVEEGRRKVAGVVRDRTAIDQTVAEAEEKIQDVRVRSEAERGRDARVIAAEAAAQEKLVHSVREADAQAQAAAFRATEIGAIAQAELSAAEKQAKAKCLLAEGAQAEQAAPGLAIALVDEARASALEKIGVAEARVMEAKAEANYKQGSADARATAEKLAAEASGKTKMGEAEAGAARAMGEAEAFSVGSLMKAEAEGLSEKFAAMSQMGQEAREHEEFRMRLETLSRTAASQIEAGQVISREKAVVLGEALKSANIQMVGGDGGMFDKLTQGMGVGHLVDGVAQSDAVQQLLALLSHGMQSARGSTSPSATDTPVPPAA